MKLTESPHFSMRKAKKLNASEYRSMHHKPSAPQKSQPEAEKAEKGTDTQIHASTPEKCVHISHSRRIEPPDNPEVSARLSNLSLRQAGSRPAWFDFEPLALPGRTRQCKKIFWEIVSALKKPQKRMIAMLADPGMGKTSFLAELHALLEHAPDTILTLAPSLPCKTPFQAVRNILEQRFYISGEAPYECIKQYVRGAVLTIVSKEEAETVSNGILALWRPLQPKSDTHQEVTQILSDGSTFSSQGSENAESNQDKTGPGLHAGSNRSYIVEADGEPVPEISTAPKSYGIKPPETHHALSFNIGPEETEYAEENSAAIEPTVILGSCQHSEEDEFELSGQNLENALESLKAPLVKLFTSDLKQNSLVIVLDDVEQLDISSLTLLSHLFIALPDDVRLTVLVTSTQKSAIPLPLQECPVEYIELLALSDYDLAYLTHHVLKKLSKTREKLIVPKDICNLIAQRSYGNPKHAMALTFRHFNPDCMIHWNEAIEKLRHEPLPHRLCLNLVQRFRNCPESKRIILQVTSPLTIPFTVSTIECILSTWPDYIPTDPISYAQILKELRDEGFLERTENLFGANTPAYTFKHECERLVINSTVKEALQRHIYCAAAQWYTLNNCAGIYDESIGDLWMNYKFPHEACRYYERSAYRALNKSHLSKAWPLFRKLLKSLPEGNISAQIQFSLDGAEVAFRTGQIDEAFRLCRRAAHHATKISAYTQSARACIQIAKMLIELGSIRHVDRYFSRANMLLNNSNDPKAMSELYSARTMLMIFESQYQEARNWLKKAREEGKQAHLRPREILYLDWLEAEIELNSGDPNKALEYLIDILQASEPLEANHLKAISYRSLGNLYDKTDNISEALEAWNKSLGIVQEMNDTILHAQLLADISDGALELEARKTARDVTEQCLGLAQQTHQKLLIARCLANTGNIQYASGQYDKALRSLRKAHRSALSLKNVHLWTRTLSLYSQIYANPLSKQYAPEKSQAIQKSLNHIFEKHSMHLNKARHMLQMATNLLETGDKSAACNAYRLARAIYIQSGLEKPAEKIQSCIDTLLEDPKS